MQAGGADGCIDLKMLVGVKGVILIIVKGQQQVASLTKSVRSFYYKAGSRGVGAIQTSNILKGRHPPLPTPPH